METSELGKLLSILLGHLRVVSDVFKGSDPGVEGRQRLEELRLLLLEKLKDPGTNSRDEMEVKLPIHVLVYMSVLAIHTGDMLSESSRKASRELGLDPDRRGWRWGIGNGMQQEQRGRVEVVLKWT